MTTVDAMVEALDKAARDPMALVDQFAAFYTENVYVRHFPPMSADGMKTREHVVDLYRAEVQVWMKHMPDYHHEDVRVWKSAPDEIQLTVKLVGTLPTGVVSCVPVRFVMKVRDGKIYDAGLEANAEATLPMMEFVKNTQMPVELIWNP